jgi:hypothetical protein
MDENVPVHVSAHGQRGRHAGVSEHKPKSRMPNVKMIFISIGIVLVIAIAVLAGLSFYRSTTASAVDTTKYQAVFLNSGAVYFGKLEILNSSYMRLTDVYYLQTKTADTVNPQPAASSTSTNLELVKLGSELQGPTDEMIINKDQVTFFENLKSDGKVTQSIEKYKKQ